MLSQQIRSILTNPLHRLWWKNNRSKPAVKKQRLIVETLEPRILLSADFPVIAPILSNGIDQLDDTLDGFFSHELLNTPLPGISLYEQIDEETLESYAPTLTDLLSVDVSKDANSKLKEFDTNGDDKVTIQEFSSGFVEKARDFLDSVPTDPDDPNAKIGDDFRSFLETSDINKSSSDVSNFLDVSNVEYTENPSDTVISLDFSFTHTQDIPIDLGVQAEQLGIVLLDLEPTDEIDTTEIELASSLTFNLSFGVMSSGEVPTHDDFFIELNDLEAQVNVAANPINTDINFGFLGASINNGNLDLTAAANATINDISAPIALGFTENQFGEGVPDQITAENQSLVDIKEDVSFYLRVDDGNSVLVTLPAGNYVDLAGLQQELQTQIDALENPWENNISLTVSNTESKLTLTVEDTESVEDAEVPPPPHTLTLNSRLSLTDLQNTPLDTLFDITDANSNFELNLPIKVDSGLNFDPQGLVIDITADPFAQSLEDRRIDLDLNLGTDFDDLLNFNALNSADFISLLRQVGNFLTNFGQSEAISSFEIPFTNKDLGDVLDFADMWLDSLVYDDGDNNDSNTTVAKLFNPNPDRSKNESTIEFETAQELATELAKILFPSELLENETVSDETLKKILPQYDPDTQELSYSLEFIHNLFKLYVPLAFDLDLAPLANITSDAMLELGGTAGMTLTLGLDLGEVDGVAFLDDNSSLTVNANAANLVHIIANENVEGLNSDGYKKILTDATLTINNVDISTIHNPDGYGNISELVRALNNAIDDSSLKDQVEFSSQGKRLLISTTDSGTLKVAPNSELGFIAAPGDTVINGNNYDFVITAQNGTEYTEYGISLGGRETITVAKLQEVIETATNDHVTLTINEDSTGFKLSNTPFDAAQEGLFNVKPVNASAAAFLLGIVGVDAAQDEEADGIIEGQSIAGPTLLDRFFMENAKLWGDIGIATKSIDLDNSGVIPSNNDITASAIFGGFVEIKLEGGGELSAHLEAGLKSPGATEAGGHVTLAQLTDSLDRYESLDNSQFDDEIQFNVWLNGTSNHDNGGNPYTVTLDADRDRNTTGELVAAINQQLNEQGISNYVEVVPLGSGFDIKLVSEANSNVTFSLQGVSDSLAATEGLALPENKTDFALDNPFNVGHSKVFNIVAPPTIIGTGGVGQDGQNIYGELELEVKLNSLVPGINLLDGTGTPKIKLVAEHFGDPFGIDPYVEDGAGPKITVDTTSLDNFNLGKFADFGFDGIINALEEVSKFFGQFESFGFLDESIPLINHSVNDLIGFADDFNTAIQQVRNDPAGSIQVLESKLKNALGLPVNSNAINFSLDTEDILKIELNLDTNFADSLGIDLGVGDESGLLTLAGAANLDTTGNIELALDFGIDLNDPAQIYLFSTTGLAAFLNVDATNVNFRGAIGPAGLSVRNGFVKIGAEFNAGLKDFGEGSDRILITELLENPIGDHVFVNFDGTLDDNSTFIDSNLPVYLLTDLPAGDLIIRAQDFFNIEVLGLEDILSKLDFDNLNPLDQVLLLVDGFDIFLGGLQDLMDGEIGGISLPLIGDSLEEGARFIENFRNGFIEDFRANLETAADPDQNFISKELLKLMGTSGLNLLQDSNNDGVITQDDINLTTNIGEAGTTTQNISMEWDMDLGGEVLSTGAGIDFDLGIPGLGLETKGDVNLDIGWALDFGFGINGTDGVYFKLFDPSQPELHFDVLASLNDAELIGKLAFLQLNITQDETEPTYLLASFAVDLYKQGDTEDNYDKHLSFSELGQIRINPLIAAKAEVNLDMELSIEGKATFPKVRTDFVLDWSLGEFDVNFDTPDPSLKFSLTPTGPSATPYTSLMDIGDTIQDGLKLVEFQNVSLDLGSYITDVVKPVLEQIQDVTEPLQPIIDFLTTPFPVLSDLGLQLTFLDLAKFFGKDYFDVGFLESVIEIVDFVNSIDTSSFDELWINFDDFPIVGPNVYAVDLTDANLKLGEIEEFMASAEDNITNAIGNVEEGINKALDGNATGGNNDSKSRGFYNEMELSGSFDFPILNDRNEIFNLLLGKPATLITYDMKPLKVGFEYSQYFPIFLILGARIGGSVGASIDFDFGFDTYGIQKFAESGFVNPELIFAGFFVDETLPDGKDHPELQLTGSLWAAAELNLLVAYGGVSGGLYATVNFDLFDPNNDGKVRVDEMINSIAFADNNPLAVFDISGDVRAKMGWYVGINYGFIKWEKSGTIVDFKLIDFEVDFPRKPVLASELGGGDLQLNMGDLADQRLNGDTSDIGETFTLTDIGNGITVVSGNSSQTFYDIDTVVIRGGEGDDTITLANDSDLAFDIEGGVGNDVIDVSGTSGQVIVRGNAGDDEIYTGSGADRIWGDEGNDTINAGGGVDWVFGDSGKIKETQIEYEENGEKKEKTVVEYIKVRANGTDGADTIEGGFGDDILIGGGGLDTINGGDDNDLIIGDRGRVIFGDNNTDSNTRAGDRSGDRVRSATDERVKMTVEETNRGLEGGNDILNGDSGQDTIYGGVGYDQIFGGDDNDTLFGEKGVDTIKGEKGIDYIFGGEDGDKISGGEDGDFLYGNDGGDEIQGDSGSDEIYGGAGADILHGNDDRDTIYGGSDPDLIYGDAGNDVLDGEAGSDIVFGYTGHFASLTEDEKFALTSSLDIDQITSSLGNDVLDGEGQGDQYIINMSGGTTTKHVTVFDTGLADDGADKMTINSTTDESENEADKNDRFLLRSGVAQDTIAFVAMLNGTEDVERIDYDHRIEAMTINSFAGEDYFTLDDNRAVTTINGGTGKDTFQVGQMFDTPRTVEAAHILPHDNDKPHDGSNEVGTDIFATIETTRGFLSNGISESTTINGGDDNDTFTVFHNKAVLGLSGGDGNDEFTIRSFALSGSQEVTRERTDLSGGADADLIQYAVNAPVNIDGGDGLDEIRLIGTEFSDDFVVTSKGVFGAGLNVNFVNVELLKIDAAEGDDRFFIQSTDANLVTKLIGGLGSDSFNVGGDAPPIISNDLLGHSGVISHTVVSDDPAYNGIRVEGISANIADNDEPGIVITQSDGNSVVNSAGFTQDSYTVVLTRAPAPGEKVVVTALAPTKESDERAFLQFDSNDGFKDSIQLVFDSSNWNVSQSVSFMANNSVVGSDSLFGTINHTISSMDSIIGTISSAANDSPLISLDQAIAPDLELTGATIKITEGLGKGQVRGIDVANGSILELRTAWNIVPDATSVYEITLADDQTSVNGQVLNAANKTIVTVNGTSFGLDNAGGELRGATLQITGGAGAGQERLIMSNTADTLVLNKPWTTSLDSSSEFQILRYGAVKAVSVDVYVNDAPAEPADTTQTPGVKVTQTAGSTDVIEGLNTDSYSLNLTAQPTADVKVYVQPEPTITTRGQIFAKEAQVTASGTSLQSDENGQFLVFTPENWLVAQSITVSAIDDGFVDGGDTKVFAPMPQIINQVQGPLYMEGMGESEISIGSINNPLMLPGETNQKPALGSVIAATAHNITVDTQNIPEKYGDLVDYTLEITAGEGKGQARIITGYNPDSGIIALDRAWEDLPNDTSQFTISTTNPNLLVDETEQVDVVTVFNNDSVTDDAGVLTENRLSGFGMGNQIVLEGNTFKGGINYFEMENFTANLGKGDNQLTINSTHTRDDGFRTVTVINAGQGDDAIDVNLSANQGLIAIKGETGNDNIDATDSELGIIAFGDEGDDQLTGGSGKDTLLGDLGRIDYLNEAGDVVTRFGLAHDFNTMFAVPQQDDETPADQTDGVARSPTVILSLHEEISGADKIIGLGGDDLIIGGSGTDDIEGSENNDIVLGDNGFVNFDPNSRINTVSTMTPLQGSGDIIKGGAGHDLIFAGTGDDDVQGDSDNDLIFGDHGRAVGNVDLSTLPLATLTPAFEFETIDTQVTDGGGDDTLRGNSGEDIILGQQGADLIYGGQDDDDLIGGHNVEGGHDTGDRIGGGSGDDVIAGDNAIIERRGDTLSLLAQTLTGSTLYDANGVAQISGDRHADPAGTQIRNITLLDHSDTTQQGVYGDDYIAGSADNDVIFGQLGDDKIQGDGTLAIADISASVAPEGTLTVTPSFEAETNGDDYIEGNGGDDLIAGNLGQDDIIGGSSNLFGLTTPDMRPDGADLIFGGAETRIDRNDTGLEGQIGHARDADVILGDNANIFRMTHADSSHIRFNHDLNQQQVVRTYTLLDYTLGGGTQDIGTGDELHGEGGDDILHGMTGNDVLFGEGQDDDLYGGSGHDRLYGGTGVDGALGDDGLIYTSRNGTAEPLYGIITANHEGKISIPGPVIGAIVYPDGQINKSVELLAYDQGATGNGNDVIYGGLGHDYLHGGEGDDAISGAEAQAGYYHSQAHVGTITGIVDGQSYSYQTDTPIPFTTTPGVDPDRGQFDAYNADDPRTKIAGFLLNFDAVDAQGNKISDGSDRIFGDLGSDWLVGGTENDRLFGGWGNDLMNADDNLETNNGLNNAPDAPEFADGDFVFGGAGLDVMIANTGKDRLFDWSGEFNSYVVPFSPFGSPTSNRAVSPHIKDFIADLGVAGGADISLTEPYGELGLVTSADSGIWQDQKGSPRDPQPGNIPGVQMDDRGTPEWIEDNGGKGNTDKPDNSGNKPDTSTGKPDNSGNKPNTSTNPTVDENILSDPAVETVVDVDESITPTPPVDEAVVEPVDGDNPPPTPPVEPVVEPVNEGDPPPPVEPVVEPVNEGDPPPPPVEPVVEPPPVVETVVEPPPPPVETVVEPPPPPIETVVEPPPPVVEPVVEPPPPVVEPVVEPPPPVVEPVVEPPPPPIETVVEPPPLIDDTGKDTGNPHTDENPTGKPHEDGTGNPHDPQDGDTETGNKDKDTGKDKNKDTGKSTKSALDGRLNAFESNNSTVTSDIMLFDETTGIFVDSNEQSAPDDLMSDDFLIIGKEDALSSGSAGLIAW
jgi:Ca2+-binding RTX toxin-like protein